MRIENRCKRRLMSLARAFAKAEDIPLVTVSRRVHGAAHFLESFERGEVTVTLSKYDEMVTTFRRSWPKGIKWPVRRNVPQL